MELPTREGLAFSRLVVRTTHRRLPTILKAGGLSMTLLLLTADTIRCMTEPQGPQFFVESPTVREGLSHRQQRPNSTRSRIRVRPNTSPYEMVSRDQSAGSLWGDDNVRRLSDGSIGEIPYSSSGYRSRGEGVWQVKFCEGNYRTRTLELASTASNYDDGDSRNSNHQEGDDVLPLLKQGKRREHHDPGWKHSKDDGLEGRESGAWYRSDSKTVGSWEQQRGNSQLRRSIVRHSDKENINSTELSITCSSSADPLISSARTSTTSPSPIGCIGRDNDHSDEASMMEASGEAKDVSMNTPRTAPSDDAVMIHHRQSLSVQHHAEDAKHAPAAVVEDAGEIVATVDATAANESDLRMNPVAESYERGRWLLGLLVLQSSSSFVLNNYQDLLRDHVVVTLFLTMLVGAGGNAGNQSAIKVIRGLATGRFTADSACALRVIGQQALVGLVLGTALSAGGFVRVWVTDNTTFRDALAISMSLFFIVMTSVLLGSALPFGFARTGVDPAHAGTSIQVAMDIIGVAITCVTCSVVLTQLDHALSVPVGAL